jgi:hypothetical protein
MRKPANIKKKKDATRGKVSQLVRRYYSDLKAGLAADSEAFFEKVMEQAHKRRGGAPGHSMS